MSDEWDNTKPCTQYGYWVADGHTLRQMLISMLISTPPEFLDQIGTFDAHIKYSSSHWDPYAEDTSRAYTAWKLTKRS